MQAIIVRIETAGPQTRARRLVFDEAVDPRTTSAAVVKALSLQEGATIDTEELESSLAQVELPLAKERALLLLGYRERSSAELERKLIESGYPHDTARAVVERFTEVELIDDARFASAWARSRVSGGYGRRRIARELAEKGVAPDVAFLAIDEALQDSDEVTRARESLRGRAARDRKERDRLVRRLVSRGFELSTALEAVNAPPVADDASDL